MNAPTKYFQSQFDPHTMSLVCYKYNCIWGFVGVITGELFNETLAFPTAQHYISVLYRSWVWMSGGVDLEFIQYMWGDQKNYNNFELTIEEEI